jgi:hypothetical protein
LKWVLFDVFKPLMFNVTLWILVLSLSFYFLLFFLCFLSIFIDGIV